MSFSFTVGKLNGNSKAQISRQSGQWNSLRQDRIVLFTMAVDKTEEKSSNSSAGKDKTTAVVESENETLSLPLEGFSTNSVTETILIVDDIAKNKCVSDIDDTKTEIQTRTLLGREELDLNNSSDLQDEPLKNGDGSLTISLRLESDKRCKWDSAGSVESVSSESNLVKTTGISDCENMASSQSDSVCVEIGGLADRDDGSEIFGKVSARETRETVIYVCEGDNLELESDVCRICHCGDETEVLISPCLCTGSVKFVHHSCLMNWLQRVVMSKCELCLFPLAVKRKRKPFKKWRLPEDKPFPILWLFTFVVAMTLNIASIAKDGSQRCVSDPCIIFYVLGSAGALLGLAFFYHWLRKTVRYFAKWIALNQEWSLVGSYECRERDRLGQTNLACSTKTLSQPDATNQQIA
ncbi:uncharacterized protein [Montipora foliosa]|uniref:uncharacterized protein isoform X3 n=1 Tax=Montipora foliosa TaxID=591990 RepID=UPI0035F200A5